jgi:hypothetical protein
VASVPVAFAFKPTAVELAPVAAACSQAAVSKTPAAPEKHWAKTGETPNTVTIPAAAARLRSVPPSSMLLASRCPRHLQRVALPERADVGEMTGDQAGRFVMAAPLCHRQRE